jgi:CRISPR-associated protein Cmr6
MDARGRGRSDQPGGRGRDFGTQRQSPPRGGSTQRGEGASGTRSRRHYPLPLDTQQLLGNSPAMAFTHPGLAFQRFIWYELPWQIDQKHQQRVLNDIATRTLALSKETSTFSKALKALHDRTEAAQQMLIRVGWHARSLSGTVDWRLVTGLGAAGILEGSGMVLHRLYGFPYLPASGLKGLIKHYLRIEEQPNDADPLNVQIFGDQEQRGTVVFWDAIPETWPTLDVDIINVHLQEYYTQDSERGQAIPPADYLSPNPVYFLTISAGTTFRFRLLSRNRDLLERTVDYTRKALALLGFGAKTRAGYGGISVAEG